MRQMKNYILCTEISHYEKEIQRSTQHLVHVSRRCIYMSLVTGWADSFCLQIITLELKQIIPIKSYRNSPTGCILIGTFPLLFHNVCRSQIAHREIYIFSFHKFHNFLIKNFSVAFLGVIMNSVIRNFLTSLQSIKVSEHSPNILE